MLAIGRRARPATEGGPPVVDVRYLHKVYGQPGPIGRAWRSPQRFAERVLRSGAQAFHPRTALERILPLGLVLSGALYLSQTLQTTNLAAGIRAGGGRGRPIARESREWPGCRSLPPEPGAGACGAR